MEGRRGRLSSKEREQSVDPLAGLLRFESAVGGREDFW